MVRPREKRSLREGREAPALGTVGIVGHGHFGALTETLLEQFAPDVSRKIFTPEASVDAERFFDFEAVAASDAVVLAVPISQYESVLEQLVPHLRPETVLVDIATVKEYTVGLIKRLAPGQPFVSLHPMFGPESYRKRGGDVRGFKVVIADKNLPPRALKAFRKSLKQNGADVREMSPEEHDRMLANTLFVTHLVGQTLSRAGFGRTAIDTASFGWLMDAVESVSSDTALFEDVYRYNRFCKDALYRYTLAEGEVNDLFLAIDAEEGNGGV